MTAAARRLVGVLLLVVGVLAMHGLGGAGHGSHGAATMPAMSASPALATAPSERHLPHARAVVAVGPVVAVRMPAGLDAAAARLGSGRPDVVAVAAGLCLAVLLGAGLLRRAGGGWLAAPAGPVLPPTVRTCPPGRGPPRLLLAQLCVLRT